MEVSSIPRPFASVTATGRSGCRCRAAAHPGPPVEDSYGDESIPLSRRWNEVEGELCYRSAVPGNNNALTVLDTAQNCRLPGPYASELTANPGR